MDSKGTLLLPLTSRGGQRPDVIFLPGIGGHVFTFAPIADLMHSSGIGLRTFGSESGETPFASIEALAGHNLAALDDANLRRSARAAVAAGARVRRAMEILGDDIPDHLAEAGRLRLEHRQASLEELGALADPPMTKDAVAGRIRRLLATADKRASELGLPGTDAALAEADIDALEAELHAELDS